MAIDVKSLPKELDRIARGDTPAELALTWLSAAVDQGGDFDGRLDSALREVSWRLSNAKAAEEPLKTWYEVYRRVSSRLRHLRQDEDARRLAWGFEYAADQLSRRIRFFEVQPRSEVLAKKHVRTILTMLAKRREALPRKTIADELRLNDANLSRVMNVLIAHDLVTRSNRGKEALFEATEAAREVVGETVAKPFDRSVDLEDFALPAAMISPSGGAIVQNGALQEFSNRYDLPDIGSCGFDEWFEAVTANADRSYPTTDGWRVRMSDGDWFSLDADMLSTNNQSLVLRRVTEEQAKLEEMEKTISEQQYTLRKYEEEIAALRKTVDSQRLASKAVRNEILQSMMTAQKLLSAEHIALTAPLWFDKVAKTMSAVKSLTEYLLLVPEKHVEKETVWSLRVMLNESKKSHVDIYGKPVPIKGDGVLDTKMLGDYSECRAALTHTFAWWGGQDRSVGPHLVVKEDNFVLRFPSSAKDATIDALAHRHSMKLVDAGSEFELWYPARAAGRGQEIVTIGSQGRRKVNLG